MRLKKPSVLAIALVTLAQGCIEEQLTPVETLFVNGIIYTANQQQQLVSSLGLNKDKLTYIGDAEGTTNIIDEYTEIIDLQGKMIIPGLHDVHIHLPGIVESNNCDLAGKAYSLAELVPRLKQCIARLNLPKGSWLTVEQWGYAQGNEPSVNFPTARSALDAVSLEHPIILLGDDGHHGAVNSYAMNLATDKNGVKVGLNAETLANEFSDLKSLIGIDRHGEPNGVLNEDARKIVNLPNLWGYPEVDFEVYQKIAVRLAASGITSAMDAALRIHEIDNFAKWAKKQPLTYRLTAAFYPEFEDYRSTTDAPIEISALIADLKIAQERHKEIHNLKIDTAKVFIDGVIEGDPYAYPPMLPNAAVLHHYRQPIFTITDDDSLEVVDYVDTNSRACVTVQEKGIANLSGIFTQNFYAENGFLASQCIKSKGVLEKEYSFIKGYTKALFGAGINVHSHAIGDRAVRLALDTFDAAKRASPNSEANVSIAHAQLIHPDDISRIAQLEVFMAFTYSWIEPFDQYQMMVSPFIDKVFNENDLFDSDGYVYQNTYPTASVKKAGGILVSGSDAPVETRDPRPFLNIEKAVTRKNDVTGRVYNPDERLSVADILDAYTINGAKMLNQAEITGSLELGKKADFVILDQNLLTLEAEGRSDEISDTQILSTWFNGKKIYSKPQS
ncbi:MAG: amidohydrolase family protein [Porticoccaceae bacterium]|nr:amidohydrolase family protein [Porticoccaceae bacterium]